MDHPRYGALSWMVRFFVMEPSTISVFSVEGSALETEPSVIRASNVEGPENRMVAGRVDSVMPGQVFRGMTSASPGKPKIGKLQEMF